MEFKDIRFERHDAIAVVTLDRPEDRNAITGANTIQEIGAVCEAVNADLTVKALIVTGADPAFSSGGNVKEMAKKSGMFGGSPCEIMANYRNNVQKIPHFIRNVEVPTIAAVNGPAIGAGCDLTLMCDIRVASKKARFGETFLSVGIIPGDGGAYFLPRAVGLARACEMTFTGDIIDGAEAYRIGLANHLAEHDALMDKAMEIARKIANKPPHALRMAKRLLMKSHESSLEAILDMSAAYQALCHDTEDHMEALSAMFEKRTPNFTGK